MTMAIFQHMLLSKNLLCDTSFLYIFQYKLLVTELSGAKIKLLYRLNHVKTYDWVYLYRQSVVPESKRGTRAHIQRGKYVCCAKRFYEPHVLSSLNVCARMLRPVSGTTAASLHERQPLLF